MLTETTTGATVSRATELRDVVVLTLPSTSAYLSVLRTATAGLAARLDFTLDEIEDLRIAVDEACAMLLSGPVEGAELTCRFELSGDQINVSITMPTRGERLPSRETFAWTVLSALAGQVDARGNGDGTVTISLLKRKDGAA